MPNPIADYLFLAALFVPTAGILVGVIYLLVSSPSGRSQTETRTQAMEAKAHV